MPVDWPESEADKMTDEQVFGDQPIAELIAELQEANSKRTKGKWESCSPTTRGGITFGGNEIVADNTVIIQWNGFDSADGTKRQKQVNSRFIALAANNMTALLEHIKVLEDRISTQSEILGSG